jgi:hypothetical protein
VDNETLTHQAAATQQFFEPGSNNALAWGKLAQFQLEINEV